ncbi:MAG: hypothetical protein RLZZ124_1450 [Cyanobacteriota bacterium]
MIWRWIPLIEADGPTQMALDGWMLRQVADGGGAPLLRLYRWCRPTLSLGVHQRRLEPHWPELAAAGVIDIVRRPSGGRAVLHAGELSYALAMRPATTRRLEAYDQACRWLREAFAALGQPLRLGRGSARLAGAASSCFASSTGADLVDASGVKRIGSAQLWRGPVVLQHGSLPLAPPRGLWRQVFGEEAPSLPSLPCGPDALERGLRSAAEHHLCGGALVDGPLTPAEWQAVQVGRQAYVSPLACIERATGARAMPRG